MTKDWTDILFYLAPMVVAAGGMYMLVKNMFDRDYRIKLIDAKRALQKEALPLRLQAYERMTLFLERISPNNLLYRVQTTGMKVRDLQTELLSNVRSEYEHNITQQIYLSAEAWQTVKSAKEDMIKIINVASGEIDSNANAIELSKRIFEVMMREENIPTQKAIDFLKMEVAHLF